MESQPAGADWLADRTGGGGSAGHVQEVAARELVESERTVRDSDRYPPGCRAAVRRIRGEQTCSWYAAATNRPTAADRRDVYVIRKVALWACSSVYRRSTRGSLCRSESGCAGIWYHCGGEYKDHL